MIAKVCNRDITYLTPFNAWKCYGGPTCLRASSTHCHKTWLARNAGFISDISVSFPAIARASELARLVEDIAIRSCSCISAVVMSSSCSRQAVSGSRHFWLVHEISREYPSPQRSADVWARIIFENAHNHSLTATELVERRTTYYPIPTRALSGKVQGLL